MNSRLEWEWIQLRGAILMNASGFAIASAQFITVTVLAAEKLAPRSFLRINSSINVVTGIPEPQLSTTGQIVWFLIIIGSLCLMIWFWASWNRAARYIRMMRTELLNHDSEWFGRLGGMADMLANRHTPSFALALVLQMVTIVTVAKIL